LQIEETLNEGLRREYALVIPKADIDARVDKQLAEVSGRVQMPGFRPGKVPANLVRKMHGAALRQEALDGAVKDGIQQLLNEKSLRPATQPEVELTTEDPNADVGLKVSVELLPVVEPGAIEGIALEKLVVEPNDEELDAALSRLAEQQKRFDAAAPDHVAQAGDVVVVDFEGKVDGELFEGGRAEGIAITLGEGRLIPGFEDQLVGSKANDQREVRVTFPADYATKYLSGRDAVFDVLVNEVRTEATPAIDDEFAKGLGLDDLAALREIMKDQVESELAGLTRTHMKRKLLDHLAASHDFAVPQGMVESEFQQIWKQLADEAARESDPAKAIEDLEAERADYHTIAERRVRLGLLLSEIGRRAGIEVSQTEMNRLIGQEAARYPQNQQQQIVKLLRENPMAAAQLRAPLYEEKVVDHLIAAAIVTERPSTRAEIQAALESEEGALGGMALPSGEAVAFDDGGHVHGPDCDHDHDHDDGDHEGHVHG
jgi:trigger factor